MDVGSVILSALALAVGLGALWCGRRAFGASHWRERLAWLGRSFALLGAAFAIWFPAELYGEIAIVIRTGGDDLVWLPTAIWYSAATMPLIVIPALVSLRSTRAGALLFIVSLAYALVDEVFHPFGVFFPDAAPGPAAYLFGFGPRVLTPVLLLASELGPVITGRQVGLAWPSRPPRSRPSARPSACSWRH